MPMKYLATVMTVLASIAIPICVAHAEPPTIQPPTVPETRGPSSSGEIDDSIANRLSIGMSDTEVLTLAGPPKSPKEGNLSSTSRWTYVVRDQVMELSFGSGRIVEIKWFPSKP
jgi:hypothetical protein